MTIPWKNTLIAAGIMLLTAALLGFVQQSGETQPTKPLSGFPLQIGDWQGQTARFDSRVYDKLGVDDSFLANYRDENGGVVNLYIGFHNSQKEGDLIHSPKNCMPGAGWGIARTAYEQVASRRGDAKVIKLILTKGAEKQVVLYWFHSRGRIIHSEYWQKIYLVIDSITRHRTDGSFVRLIAPVRGGDIDQTTARLKGFAAQLMPLLDEYLPS